MILYLYLVDYVTFFQTVEIPLCTFVEKYVGTCDTDDKVLKCLF